MTAVRTQIDIGDTLNRLIADVAYLKQLVTSPSIMGLPSNPTFETITIDKDGDSVVLHPAPPDAVTNINVVTGSFYDQIFADVSWDAAVTGEPAATFDIEVALDDGGPTLVDIRRVGGDSVRLAPLEPDTDYTVRIYPINRTGSRGLASPWVDFTTGHDATVPPVPVDVDILRGATTVLVKFTGLTAIQAPDVANGNGIYEIEIDTSNAFNTADKRTMRTSATIAAFSDVLVEGDWYARVSAIDAAGNQGGWSAIAGPAQAGGVIDSMVVAGLSAAKITVGEMAGDRISTNTLHVNKLLDASTMTARTINIGAGGQFSIGNPTGGAGTSGILVNDQGIRLYLAGTPTVILDALTGSAHFEGDIYGSYINGSEIDGGLITGSIIRTDVAGQRTTMGDGFNGIELWTEFRASFPGFDVPARIIAFDDFGSSRPILRIEGPREENFNAPNPHIDLIGGTGTLGDIKINASGSIELNATTYLNGNTLYLRDSANAYEAIWGVSPGILVYRATQHEFQTNNVVRALFAIGNSYIYSNLRVGTYLYADNDNTRVGELYGQGGIHRTSGRILVDSADSHVYLTINGVAKFVCESTGYNRTLQPLSLEQNILFVRDSGDNNHRLNFNSTLNGPVLVGYDNVSLIALGGGGGDVMERVGGGNIGRTVNAADTFYRQHNASLHFDACDPIFKTEIRQVPFRARDKIKAVKPIEFKWKKGQEHGTHLSPINWGFSADELPDEVVSVVTMGDGTEVKSVSLMGLIAINWGATGELDEEIQELRTELKSLQSRLTKIEAK